MKQLHLMTMIPKKDTSLTPKEFFLEVKEKAFKSISPAEKNFVNLFLDFGQDFSTLAQPNFLDLSTEGFKEVPENGCHQFSWTMLNHVIEKNPQFYPRLCYGFIDVWEKDCFKGMYAHSFLTMNKNGEQLVIDPYAAKFARTNKSILIKNHFGILLPYFWLKTVTSLVSRPGYYGSFPHYLKNTVLPFESENLRFRELLKRELFYLLIEH